MHEHASFNCVIRKASFGGKNLLPFDKHMCEWCQGTSMHQVEGHSGDTRKPVLVAGGETGSQLKGAGFRELASSPLTALMPGI